MAATLLQKGTIKICPHHDKFDINRINEMKAKDYILRWFRERIPSRKGGYPSIRSTGIHDRVILLHAGTGSGKSVTLPSELYLEFKDIVGKTIAVTQPRVLLAKSIPQDIVKYYPDLKMGRDIGYQTKEFILKPKSGILFMTSGILTHHLKTMSDQEIMRRYSFIVVDECHDQSLELANIQSLLKMFLNRNSTNMRCPFVIFTSATFDTNVFSDFFGLKPKNTILMKGSTFKINEHFLEEKCHDYIEKAVEIATQIHVKNTDDYKHEYSGIIIFVHGAPHFENLKIALNKKNKEMKNNNHFVVIGLNRKSFNMGTVDYQNMFKPHGSIVISVNKKTISPKRKIIVSTNIAETGITIPGLKYSIDTGYVKYNEFNPILRCSYLLPRAVSKSNAMQRRGRVGRRSVGEWYPLYSKAVFDKLPETSFSNILTEDISYTILGSIIKNVYPGWSGEITNIDEPAREFRLEYLDFMEHPSVDSTSYSIEKLYLLGLIDDDYIPTAMGLCVANFTETTMENARMIIAGYRYGANIPDLITIASFMSISKQTYINTRSKNKYTYGHVFEKNPNMTYYYNRFFISDDFIKSIFILKDFMNKLLSGNGDLAKLDKWCGDNGLRFSGIMDALHKRDAIILSMVEQIGINPFHNGTEIKNYSLPEIMKKDMYTGMREIKKLKQCIYEGYRMNLVTHDKEKYQYLHNRTGKSVMIKSDLIQSLPAHEDFEQRKPKILIVHSTSLETNRIGKFGISADRVSVVDNFIDVDMTFTIS